MNKLMVISDYNYSKINRIKTALSIQNLYFYGSGHLISLIMSNKLIITINEDKYITDKFQLTNRLIDENIPFESKIGQGYKTRKNSINKKRYIVVKMRLIRDFSIFTTSLIFVIKYEFPFEPK